MELAEPEHLLSWDRGSELVVSEIEVVELPSEVWAASGVLFKCQKWLLPPQLDHTPDPQAFSLSLDLVFPQDLSAGDLAPICGVEWAGLQHSFGWEPVAGAPVAALPSEVCAASMVLPEQVDLSHPNHIPDCRAAPVSLYQVFSQDLSALDAMPSCVAEWTGLGIHPAWTGEHSEVAAASPELSLPYLLASQHPPTPGKWSLGFCSPSVCPSHSPSTQGNPS